MDKRIASLMGLGERSVQKSYYPQLRQKIRELEESQRRYRLLAENISDVIWMLDLDLNIRYISPSIERSSGYAARHLEKTPFTRLLTRDHAQLFQEAVAGQITGQKAGGGTIELELEQVNLDGSTTWIEVRISSFLDEIRGDQSILGISRDITARKKAEKEKQALQQQLLQAQKMESVGTLAGGIAHDFNNLLTIINGYAEMAVKKLDPDHILFGKLSAIHQAGKRAGDLTRQLLAFSRKQVYRPQSLDINQTLSSMDRLLRRLIGEDIRVEAVLEPELPPISADRSQIEQIFTNLVINARDALKAAPCKSKRITIETGQSNFPKDTAQWLNLPHPGPFIFFSVSDNGMGMDRKTRQRIFEPFFTTKPKNKGTGLGLAMIYGIVKQNRGSIHVYSEPGQGTLFKIYWPVAAPDAHPSEKAGPAVQTLSGHERILVVEDDREVCLFAANALMSLGYRVHKAYDGKAALEWMRDRMHDPGRRPDLVITDLVLPLMNGREFAEKAETLLPGLKVIYASGYADTHIVQNGLLARDVNFLQKPYSQQGLARMVRTVLDG